MNILEELVSVSVEPVNALWEYASGITGKSVYTIDSRLVLEARQSLSLRLTITFDNTHQDKAPLVYSFLNTVGETDWMGTWEKLFDKVVVTPFLLKTPEVADTTSNLNTTTVDDDSYAFTSPVRSMMAAPSVSGSTNKQSPNSQMLVGPRSGESPTPRAVSAPRSTPPPSSSVDGGKRKRGESLSVGGAEDNTSETPSTSAYFVFGKSNLAVPRTGKSFSGMKRNYKFADAFDNTEGVQTAGSISLSGAKTVVETFEDTGGSRRTIPKKIESTFDLEFIVPDWESDPGITTEGYPCRNLAFLLVLLPPEEGEGETASGGRRKSTKVGDRHSSLRQVLIREFTPSGPSDMPPWLHHPFLQLGSAYFCARIQSILRCCSHISPLCNDQLLMSLEISNRSAQSILLQGASFDLHSTERAVSVWSETNQAAAAVAAGLQERVTSANPSGYGRREQHLGSLGDALHTAVDGDSLSELVEEVDPHWISYRQGPRGADLRVVDILNKVVIVVPMLVSNERSPFVLHPGETYSFQFVLQVLPQFCYLVNPRSLEYVYAKQLRANQAADAVGNANPNNGNINLLKDRYIIHDFSGVEVNEEEIVSVLSSRFTTHAEIYYERSEETAQNGANAKTSDMDDKSEVAHNVRSLFHSVTWSFGASGGIGGGLLPR